MARNDNNSHGNQQTRNQASGTQRSTSQIGGRGDRRRDKVVNSVKERPYTAAALATVAAGAAAFFLTRSKTDKPLMNWGQDTPGDHVKGAGAFKQGSTTSDRSLESVGAGKNSGTGQSSSSPSATQAASLAASRTSTNAAASGGTGASTSPAGASNATSATAGKTGTTGLDQSAKTDTKVGSISYGA